MKFHSTPHLLHVPMQASQPKFSDLGGLHEQIQLLKEIVLFPLETPEAVLCRGPYSDWLIVM